MSINGNLFAYVFKYMCALCFESLTRQVLLDVIKEEGLAASTVAAGQALHGGLEKLAKKHPKVEWRVNSCKFVCVDVYDAVCVDVDVFVHVHEYM